ncbi:2-methylisocitrate lyase [mine drainage metagenome]|uniref:2-methylisocitrate lyase n=1 Tax=mine drainage metagenome TaxID=410659 RepID=T1BU30_9ZZZZ
MNPGQRLKAALEEECPLQIVGTVHAYCALLARDAGFRALYLSGAGVANAAFGLPDLAITTMSDVAEETRRITQATDLPLLVDGDTGFGGAFNIARSVRELIRSGAAGWHLEDQVAAKRCGHRPGKKLVSAPEMVDRIKAAVDARTDPDFMVMARTDAFASEGLAGVVERSAAYVEAGADAIFAEALTSLADYAALVNEIRVPILANATEFGQTPLFELQEFRKAGIRMVLYPLTAFRAMSLAAAETYATLRAEGSQKALMRRLQTRESLYAVLRYWDFERKLDVLYGPARPATPEEMP